MSELRKLMAEVKRNGARLVVMEPDGVRVTGKPLPRELIAQLRAHKSELHALLSRGEDTNLQWEAHDWCTYYDERAGIAEYDGELTRVEAEASALEHCIVKWLALNPPPDFGAIACCHCEEFAGPEALVILASDGSLHRVIHSRCHASLLEASRAEAISEIQTALEHGGGEP